MGKVLGTFRVTYLVALCCVGSFLFAYDTGVVGGVLTLPSFQKDFGITPANRATVGSNATSLLQAGVATVIIPTYSAEMAPKEIRGKLGSMFHFLFTCGVMTSYWVDYGVAENLPPTTRQWQVPIGLQLVPGGILGLGMLLTRESTRWLAKTGRTDQALQSLIWVRGGEDTTEVREEFVEILAGIREEEQATEGITWKEYRLPANRTLERIGRRGSLLAGAFLMGTYMLIIVVLSAVFPPVEAQGVTPTGAASVAMVYLEASRCTYLVDLREVLFEDADVHSSELQHFLGTSTMAGTATQWLANFVFSQITPHAVENIKWKTFLMFCIFNWALVFYVWIFIKETKGKSLEEMEDLFGSYATAQDANKVHRQMGEDAEQLGEKTMGRGL
ncbi:hypothetical protein DL766_001562 [Monosporascus sp. MC13-8B]|uniref:Major facilitator superfamily (MFS) profile domain-containing protein n=1 Tax=Monosporascus cannonballus TaxID=155416 RepID=A0ABY0GZ25_9PEZI|nr:hypothetical protein DL762_007830 [Monosporascus cannonballus]RYP37411.1 hypothetical protein DL766_001562 [Monosporascus sp. MC13-8B]